MTFKRLREYLKDPKFVESIEKMMQNESKRYKKRILNFCERKCCL